MPTTTPKPSTPPVHGWLSAQADHARTPYYRATRTDLTILREHARRLTSVRDAVHKGNDLDLDRLQHTIDTLTKLAERARRHPRYAPPACDSTKFLHPEGTCVECGAHRSEH